MGKAECFEDFEIVELEESLLESQVVDSQEVIKVSKW